MNKYGQIAKDHWNRWLPTRYSKIPDPERFFSELGEQAEEQILDLAEDLAGPDRRDEGYLEKVGRLNMAKLQAEERVLPDLILLPAEEGLDEVEEGSEQMRELVSVLSDLSQIRRET